MLWYLWYLIPAHFWNIVQITPKVKTRISNIQCLSLLFLPKNMFANTCIVWLLRVLATMAREFKLTNFPFEENIISKGGAFGFFCTANGQTGERNEYEPIKMAKKRGDEGRKHGDYCRNGDWDHQGGYNNSTSMLIRETIQRHKHINVICKNVNALHQWNRHLRYECSTLGMQTGYITMNSKIALDTL